MGRHGPPPRHLRVPPGQPAQHGRGAPRRRVRRLQRDAPHARPAQRAAVPRRLQGDEHLHGRTVRRPWHRHLHSRPAADRHEPDARHAGRQGGAQTLRPHPEDQRRVDAEHGAQRGGAAPPRRAAIEGHDLDSPRRHRGLGGVEAVRARTRDDPRRERRAPDARGGGPRRLHPPEAVPGEHVGRSRTKRSAT